MVQALRQAQLQGGGPQDGRPLKPSPHAPPKIKKEGKRESGASASEDDVPLVRLRF